MTVRLKMVDLRSEGHCASGIRAFFKLHGINLRQLVSEGIPIEELENIDDINMRNAIAEATRRTEEENLG